MCSEVVTIGTWTSDAVQVEQRNLYMRPTEGISRQNVNWNSTKTQH